MNTHRAVIESSVPPTLTLVGSGPRDFCEKQLEVWTAKHPLGEFETAMIFEAESSKRPGVIGYTVVGRDGWPVLNHTILTRQEAVGMAAEWTADCKTVGIDWDYRAAAITEEGQES